jgi:hypothetical protein
VPERFSSICSELEMPSGVFISEQSFAESNGDVNAEPGFKLPLWRILSELPSTVHGRMVAAIPPQQTCFGGNGGGR